MGRIALSRGIYCAPLQFIACSVDIYFRCDLCILFAYKSKIDLYCSSAILLHTRLALNHHAYDEG